MSECLGDGRCDPDQIDYINAHGTSTPLGDVAETRGHEAVFGDHAKQRRRLQHQEPAGPPAGRLRRRRVDRLGVWPSNGCSRRRSTSTRPIRSATSTTSRNVAREVKVDRVMSNSFGFGGHNASLLIGRYS